MLKLSDKGSNLGLAPCFFIDGQVVNIYRENCPRKMSKEPVFVNLNLFQVLIMIGSPLDEILK